jgi:hypothetical protein
MTINAEDIEHLTERLHNAELHIGGLRIDAESHGCQAARYRLKALWVRLEKLHREIGQVLDAHQRDFAPIEQSVGVRCSCKWCDGYWTAQEEVSLENELACITHRHSKDAAP